MMMTTNSSPPKGFHDSEMLLVVIYSRRAAILGRKGMYFTRKISKHYDFLSFTGHVSRSLNV